MGTERTSPSNVFCVSRTIFDHPIVGAGNARKEPWSTMEAWLWLVSSANYRPSEIEIRGEIVTIERGQYLTTVSALADRWKWTEKQVRGFLDKICRHNLVTRETGTPKGSRPSIITICNYGVYQFLESQLGQPKRQAKGSPRAAQGQHPIKNNKENTEEGLTPAPIDEAREAVEAWNATAEQCGLTQEKLTPDLRPKIRARLKEGGLEGWREAMSKVAASDYLCGKVLDRPFKATLDFVVKPDKFRCIRRGDYANRYPSHANGAAYRRGTL